MIKRNKRISICAVIINILLLVFAILSVVFKNNFLYAWYWLFVTLMLLFEVLYVWIWSKVGKNVDKHKSSTINRSFNDITTVSIVLSGLLYLSVLFNYLAVYNANKETKELVEKTFNKKK